MSARTAIYYLKYNTRICSDSPYLEQVCADTPLGVSAASV